MSFSISRTASTRGALLALLMASPVVVAGTLADDLAAAASNGKTSADFRLRYESVDVTSRDSDGLTLRSRLGYATGAYHGVSAFAEVEDVRNIGGINDEDALIADPEVTEIDQAYLKFDAQTFTGTLGRQVITHDGHRQVGHVGFRQDRQTFDAARIQWSPAGSLTVDLTHVYKRNRIFGETADIDSSDNLLNVSVATPLGKLSGYGYLLHPRGGTDLDTFGARLTGNTSGDIRILYALEAAVQDAEATRTDTDYLLIELGAVVSGITLKAGHEVLGSDSGQANFATPLATVHKFAGWADQFIGGTINGNIDGGNGLADTYVSVSSKLAGIKLLAAWHNFESDQGSTDLGSELDLLAVRKFGKHYSAGAKYADYSAGPGGNDVSKLWVWVGMRF